MRDGDERYRRPQAPERFTRQTSDTAGEDNDLERRKQLDEGSEIGGGRRNLGFPWSTVDGSRRVDDPGYCVPDEALAPSDASLRHEAEQVGSGPGGVVTGDEAGTADAGARCFEEKEEPCFPYRHRAHRDPAPPPIVRWRSTAPGGAGE